VGVGLRIFEKITLLYVFVGFWDTVGSGHTEKLLFIARTGFALLFVYAFAIGL
jgi:hypothetical protein